MKTKDDLFALLLIGLALSAFFGVLLWALLTFGGV